MDRSPQISRPATSCIVVAVLGLLLAVAPVAAAQACAGDCSQDGEVTIDEVLRIVTVALGAAEPSECLAADRNGDGIVSVEEVVFALQMALQGCPAARPFQHGMNLASWWNGTFASPGAEAALEQLARTDVDTIVVVPTYYMATSTDSVVFSHPQKTESLAALADILGDARARGFRTALKPHVDSLDGLWRGRIAPEDIDGWFASYEEHMVALATLANSVGCDMFVVASEIQSLSGAAYAENWRRVVASVREVYGGEVAYAANWDGYRNVGLWDFVDVVGIQAYFPLSDAADPSFDELVDAWLGADGWMVELFDWYAATFASGSKRLVFTEIGYVASDFAVRRPWEMQDDCFVGTELRPFNGALQARAYAALLQAGAGLDGIFWWHWEPYALEAADGQCRYSPQGKPAEAVLQVR